MLCLLLGKQSHFPGYIDNEQLLSVILPPNFNGLSSYPLSPLFLCCSAAQEARLPLLVGNHMLEQAAVLATPGHRQLPKVIGKLQGLILKAAWSKVIGGRFFQSLADQAHTDIRGHACGRWSAGRRGGHLLQLGLHLPQKLSNGPVNTPSAEPSGQRH